MSRQGKGKGKGKGKALTPSSLQVKRCSQRPRDFSDSTCDLRVGRLPVVWMNSVTLRSRVAGASVRRGPLCADRCPRAGLS